MEEIAYHIIFTFDTFSEDVIYTFRMPTPGWAGGAVSLDGETMTYYVEDETYDLTFVTPPLPRGTHTVEVVGVTEDRE